MMQESVVATAAAPEAHRPGSPLPAVLVKIGAAIVGCPAVSGPHEIIAANAIGSTSPSRKSDASGDVAASLSADSQPLAIVEQALRQQQILVGAQMKQFHGHFLALNQLLEAQAKGLLQTKSLTTGIIAELQTEVAARPSCKLQVAQLQQNQAEVAGVHQLLQVSLSKLHKCLKDGQTLQIQQTQTQLGGMFNMLRAQSVQLQQSKAQALDRQAFATQAQNALHSATRSQDVLQQELQQLRSEHATEVQRRKNESDFQSRQREEREEEQRHNQALEKAFLKLEHESHELVKREKSRVCSLQQQLAKLENQGQADVQTAPDDIASPDAESEGLKSRIAALEADLTKALGEEWSDDEQIEPSRLLHTPNTGVCCWGARTLDSTAAS